MSTDGVADTERDFWEHQPIPTEAEVEGVAWLSPPLADGAPHAVACFTPRWPGPLLTPVARALGFAPLSFIPLITPDSVSMVIQGSRFSIRAFGRPMWSGLDASPALLAEARRSHQVLVLIVDQADGARIYDMPWVPPAEVWVARVPLGTGPS